MRERLFLGGVPIVGFGASNDAELQEYKQVILPPVVGYFAGSIVGAFVGDKIHRGLGTAAGAILGGVGGVAAGGAWFVHNARLAAAEKKRLQEQQAATKP